METIRKGSTGTAVKALQEKLGITADGIFGAGTEKALKAWQDVHGLIADGIAGDATWKAMGITDTTTKAVDPSVVYLPLSTHITSLHDRSIKYIVIHYTAGASSAAGRARGVKNTFEKRAASADFAVDDAEIVQLNPDLQNYYCWSVGDRRNQYSKGGGTLNGKCTNRNSISIEICSNLQKGASASAGNHEGWTYTEASLNNARKLVRILMKKYSIPLDRVIRHYDVTGKLCPGILGWNEETIYTTTGARTRTVNNSLQWQQFKNSL